MVYIEHLSSQSRCETPGSLHFIYLLSKIGFSKNVSLLQFLFGKFNKKDLLGCERETKK